MNEWSQRVTKRNTSAVSYTHLDVYKRQVFILYNSVKREVIERKILRKILGSIKDGEQYLSLIHI